MSGMVDRITGRVKQAAGDLADDPELRNQGVQEERKADAKDELARAQQEADLRAEEVARLERETARGHGAAGSTAGAEGATGGAAAGNQSRAD